MLDACGTLWIPLYMHMHIYIYDMHIYIYISEATHRTAYWNRLWSWPKKRAHPGPMNPRHLETVHSNRALSKGGDRSALDGHES